MAKQTGSMDIPDLLDGVGIIDCDSHFTEPPDLWTSWTPASIQRPDATCTRSVDGGPAGTSTASCGPASAATP